MKRTAWIGLATFLFSLSAQAEMPGRFFIEGNGIVALHNLKTGTRATVHYRRSDGTYSLEVQPKINRLFGLSSGEEVPSISLRLVSLLDFIQDQFGSGQQAIQLVSAYRSPRYNQNLRNQGKTVAQASLHLEGMAADIKIAGVSGKKLWEALRAKDCCGVGWYGGASVHVDPGPARFWTGATSKVHTDISAHNKRILVRTNRDIYLAGETIRLTLGRITQFPVGVSKKVRLISVINAEKKPVVLRSTIDASENLLRQGKSCLLIQNRRQARQLYWSVPKRRRSYPTRTAIEIDFCSKPHSEMPDQVLSNPIEIRS